MADGNSDFNAIDLFGYPTVELHEDHFAVRLQYNITVAGDPANGPVNLYLAANMIANASPIEVPHNILA